MTTNTAKKKYCHFCGAVLDKKFFEGRNRLFCNSCDSPIYENPVPATAIVVINNINEILLVKRDVEPKKGYWSLPGGFIELNETPEQGALRELKEETGISGTIECLLGVMSTDSPRYNTVLMVGYHVNKFTGILTAGDDAADVGWYKYKELPEIAFVTHDEFIKKYYYN